MQQYAKASIKSHLIQSNLQYCSTYYNANQPVNDIMNLNDGEL